MNIDQIRQRFEPDSPRVLRVRQAAKNGIKALEQCRDYPRVHLEAMEKAEAEFNASGAELPDPLIPSPARLEYELKILDIWASAYLQLVSDSELRLIEEEHNRGAP